MADIRRDFVYMQNLRILIHNEGANVTLPGKGSHLNHEEQQTIKAFQRY